MARSDRRFRHMTKSSVRTPWAVSLALVLGLSYGCGASNGPTSGRAAASPKKTDAASERVIEVSPVVVSPLSESELIAEFERAKALLLGGKYRESVEIFDKLVRLSPEGE